MRALDKNVSKPLYEQLYEQIRGEILSGRMSEGEKLPSKRSLAEQLRVSLVTVENAYAQLIAEGYVRTAQRSGYFVQYSGGALEFPERVNRSEQHLPEESAEQSGPDESAGAAEFPFSVWTRLMRLVISEKGTKLLQPVENGGAFELRAAISEYLYRSRGLDVQPRHIIIGSGTEYLYNLLIQLLGRGRCYGIEDPGFQKPARIYALNDAAFERIPLDSSGMRADALYEKRVDVAHISPAHHFPTGIVMPISRRREILEWAQSDERFIVEDDYDSEFRRSGKPVPTIFGLGSGSVIYVNTFSQTIAPSVRISYMCLSPQLYAQWREKLGFYACSVPAFEQYTLARFISEGYFERHINRTGKRYKRVAERVRGIISEYSGVRISEENAGLHFTAKICENASAVIAECAKLGIVVTPLFDYYANPADCPADLYLVNYSGCTL